jgi:hypothetical protein
LDIIHARLSGPLYAPTTPRVTALVAHFERPEVPSGCPESFSWLNRVTSSETHSFPNPSIQGILLQNDVASGHSRQGFGDATVGVTLVSIAEIFAAL